MHIATGVDLLDQSRIAASLSKSPEQFLTRVLHPKERQVAQHVADLTQYVAIRFCAKEAVAKALGCGIGEELSFQSIIVQEQDGEYRVTLDFAQQTSNKTEYNFSLSVAMEEHYIVSFCVASKVPN